ncbi:MAG: RNA polymerase sigma factor [Planctomycetes bacterium]|nr:RNA polymerase sigma factor [Planctomycetota bacterium]
MRTMMSPTTGGEGGEDDAPREAPDPGLEGLSDGECAVLAVHGSRPAQAELVRRHMGVVYRLSVRLLKDREEAADATQEAFVRAFQALGTFDRERSFRAWICAIAWNLIRDELRRRRVRKARSLGGGGAEGGGDAIDPPDRRREAPGARLERQESREAVGEALGRLEPRSRAILLLREIEGLSYGEIAEMLGWRLGTVKSRVHRARMELKDALLALRPAWFDA